ncbi:MAG: membrane protein insertase YidC [Actinomycetes bacterium]
MKILEPLYDAVTFIMLAFHSLFTSLGVNPASGLAWGGSIVGLVVVIRILLIPLFVKQINAQRGLQMLQPEIKKLQAKYKGKTDPESRQKQQQEMMKLYRDNGTNPLASCLPIVLQAPIFFALFRVLNGIGHQPNPIPRGLLNEKTAQQAADAQIFGVHLSDKFIGADSLHVQIVCAVMIVLMSATTFLTQKQLMSKNMPASAMDNPFAQQQKILLYVFPLIFAVSGVNFPVGVLLYWLTTNVWSMGQQFYVIRRNPSPGSPAFDALQKRKAEKAARHHEKAIETGGASGTTTLADSQLGGDPNVSLNGSASGAVGTGVADGGGGAAGTASDDRPSRQRQQPRRQTKRKR